MSDEQIAWSPRWYDWLMLLVFIGTYVMQFLWGGFAAVVVLTLLYFVAYRAGKAFGR